MLQGFKFLRDYGFLAQVLRVMISKKEKDTLVEKYILYYCGLESSLSPLL